MNTYKLILSYRGSHYFGWQMQPQQRSIQGELNRALSLICKSDQVRSLASGRTDAGVHALAQVVKIEMPLAIAPAALRRGLNSLLPLDVRVLEIEPCSFDFHPVYQAKWKEYHYLFSQQKNLPPLLIDAVTSYPFKLDLELMSKGAQLFCGVHDFSNFYCTGTPIKSKVRQIFECQLLPEKVSLGATELDCQKLRVRGNGFLKQMVRLMMGALWHLGRSKISLAQLEAAIEGASAGKVGPTAAPQGLYMVGVSY